MLNCLMLMLIVSEVIISYLMQIEVWLPQEEKLSDEENPDKTDFEYKIAKDLDRKIIGKFNCYR